MKLGSPAVHALIKFGERKNLERLRHGGEIYLNTWGFFKRFEANDAQGDKDEGLVAMHQISRGAQLQVDVGGRWMPIENLVGQIKISSSELENYNLLCMFALTDESFVLLDDPKLKKFGDSALLVVKGDEFLARIRKELDALGIKHESHLVEYVDKEEHEGKMGPFRKLAGYAYQSEWRLLAHAKRGGPLVISIGDISDLTVIEPIDDLKSHLRLTEAADEQESHDERSC